MPPPPSPPQFPADVTPFAVGPVPGSLNAPASAGCIGNAQPPQCACIHLLKVHVDSHILKQFHTEPA